MVIFNLLHHPSKDLWEEYFGQREEQMQRPWGRMESRDLNHKLMVPLLPPFAVLSDETKDASLSSIGGFASGQG